MKILEMPWEEVRKLLRMIGPEIGRLALRGDRFAAAVYRRYVYAYEHPDDTRANYELRIAIEDYLKRDLTISERYDLGSKFGHLVDEKQPEPGSRIVVPGSEIKQ